jgi:AbrB family looped-hinge helix DNA binding protein
MPPSGAKNSATASGDPEFQAAVYASATWAQRTASNLLTWFILNSTIHTMVSKVGERGQITIEKAIREQLGIYAGDETVQRVEDGRIVIEVVPGRHRRSLAGSLRGKVTRRPSDEAWAALRETAWQTPDPDRRP